jgi:alpha-ribazole phosphatase
MWNLEKKYQGHSDIELSPQGLFQAEKLAARLSHEKIDAVYSSDLSRAFKTAEYIADKHNLKVKTLPKLREVMFGQWEGLKFGEINERWPGEFEKLWLHPDEAKVPGGESFFEVRERSFEAFLEIVAAHGGETVVVVSHGGTIGAILCAVLDISLKHVWSIKQENTAVNIIEYNHGKPTIALLNDTHHLKVT